MNEHTPGPWTLYEPPDVGFYPCTPSLKEFFKGSVNDANGNRVAGAFLLSPLSYAEQKANFSLICAAPELLAAAEEALEALIRTHHHPMNLRKQLISGALERKLNAIGPATFDPNGRVRALLSLAAAIARAKGAA